MRMRVNAEDVVLIGMKGTVIALDGRTGAEIWRTELKGNGFVNVVREGGRILATTRGEIFCLDAREGRILWHNPLKGMGYGLITIAGAAQMPPMAQKQMDDQAAASSAAASSAAASSAS